MQTRPVSAVKVGRRHRKDLGDLEDSHFDDLARVRPCPEPLGQCEELVRSFACEGALVLDPFCGVGTVPIAAARHGRRFLGIDLEPAYVRAARARMNRLGSKEGD